MTNPANVQQICQECAMIDFDKIMNMDLKDLRERYLQGITIADLGTRISSMPQNECGLCQFFYQNRPRSYNAEERYQLRAFPYNYAEEQYQFKAFQYNDGYGSLREFQYNDSQERYQFQAFPYNSAKEQYQLQAFEFSDGYRLLRDFPSSQRKELTELPCLAIVSAPRGNLPSKGLFETIYNSEGLLSQGKLMFCLGNTGHTGKFFQPRIMLEKADLGRAREWIDYCVANHPGCHAPVGQLQGLQLIDCRHRNEDPTGIIGLVEAPKNAIYAALSYVWGNTSDEKSYTQTVSDAVIATRQLGLQYFWVDKHCIPNNKNEQDRQISKMDLIYRRAHVTIVASAGSDANHGLPGVDNTPRDSQMVVSTGECSFLKSSIPPYITIPKSKWATRGWTLQEAFLSCRRLAFTENQLYFECGRINCSEAIPHDFKLLDNMTVSLGRGVLGGLDGYSRESKLEEYRQIAAEYRGRELTKIEDALHAFAGISRSFWNEKLEHLWGIEYWNPDEKSRSPYRSPG
ncbi:HET-domain-containing protein [Hyaloscypha variabilis F]|uniref:HET-domain-containing protein n=1 Tax=Hyaloscypha variabilis (strain UAMH 11265 / GT02V1 / F) TaxID=1149755 RepID=A0A2J6R4K2_HYAVF|nr:HET-domain-containing protein [Hyaloscypha variabilis F]